MMTGVASAQKGPVDLMGGPHIEPKPVPSPVYSAPVVHEDESEQLEAPQAKPSYVEAFERAKVLVQSGGAPVTSSPVGEVVRRLNVPETTVTPHHFQRPKEYSVRRKLEWGSKSETGQ